MARDVLRTARAHIQAGWTQRAHARDESGRRVGPWHPEATTWGLVGAVVAAAEGDAERIRPVLQRLRRSLPKDDFAGASDVEALMAWNDAPGRTREDVLALLDDALARLDRAAP